MREIGYLYHCHSCRKAGLTREQLEEPEKYGWVMVTDPPSGPGGYSEFRIYCPDCASKVPSR